MAQTAENFCFRGDRMNRKAPATFPEATKAEGRRAPHALHVGVAFAAEELVAPVCPDHVLVHDELHVAPEGPVLLWGHGEPGPERGARRGSASGACAPLPPPDLDGN